METLTDEQLIQLFNEDCETRGLSKHTIVSYKSTLNLFSTFLKQNHYTFQNIDRNILKTYINYLRKNKMSISTIENRFSTLSTFYDFAIFESYVDKNIVLEARKRYLKRYKKNENNGHKRKLITIEEMAMLANTMFDLRTKAILVLFAKTGIRLRELIAIDIDEINWDEMSIRLKPTHKRSNTIVYFDYETSNLLKRWLKKREYIADEDCKALFVSYTTKRRLHRNAIYSSITSWAEKHGLHNPNSPNLEDHFTPHCCRHWFTTYLRRAGMPREYIKELRGDKRSDSMDIYYHIDSEDLRKSYLGCIPQLGII